MNKALLLLLLLIVGCTSVEIPANTKQSISTAVEKTTDIVEKAAETVQKNTPESNNTEKNNSIIEKVKDIIPNTNSTKPGYELPSITVERTLDENDVEGFGDII